MENESLFKSVKGKWLDWWRREWETISYAVPVFPFIYVAVLLIAEITLCFLDMAGLTRLIIIGSLLSVFVFISLVFKDAASLEVLMIMAVSLTLINLLFMSPSSQT